MRSRYIVQAAGARMPSSCRGQYRRVAVLEVPEDVDQVSAIDERRRDVIHIVRTWEKCHVGTTARCAYQIALRKARALADELNATSARRLVPRER